MRTRTKGISVDKTGVRTVDKFYKGHRIYERLGTVSQDAAESWLRRHQEEIDRNSKNDARKSTEPVFADGAEKYLIECKEKGVKTLELIAYHVTLLLPYVGKIKIKEISNDSFSSFVKDRLKSLNNNKPTSATTVNRTLEVARTICNRAAKTWRTANDKPWIESPPLIEMLKEKPRPSRSLTRTEETQLLARLPPHLARMSEFALNTGARDNNVCGLRWSWEHQVPDLGRSVFVIPEDETKSGRRHVLILNDVAWRIVEECRGMHDEFVFVWRRERVVNHDKPAAMRYSRIQTMNNSGFQAARKAIGIVDARPHGFRHTFATRLRAAGVSAEVRAMLLGHAIKDMPAHYGTTMLRALIEAANSVINAPDELTLEQVLAKASR